LQKSFPQEETVEAEQVIIVVKKASSISINVTASSYWDDWDRWSMATSYNMRPLLLDALERDLDRAVKIYNLLPKTRRAQGHP